MAMKITNQFPHFTRFSFTSQVIIIYSQGETKRSDFFYVVTLDKHLYYFEKDFLNVFLSITHLLYLPPVSYKTRNRSQR